MIRMLTGHMLFGVVTCWRWVLPNRVTVVSFEQQDQFCRVLFSSWG